MVNISCLGKCAKLCYLFLHLSFFLIVILTPDTALYNYVFKEVFFTEEPLVSSAVFKEATLSVETKSSSSGFHFYGVLFSGLSAFFFYFWTGWRNPGYAALSPKKNGNFNFFCST
jgi:hypothetical protein